MRKETKSVYIRRRIMVLIAVIFAVMGIKGAVGAITAPGYVCEDFTHIVQPGDTLWGIGETYCEGDMLALRYDMVTEYGSVIYPNQVIQAPQGG